MKKRILILIAVLAAGYSAWYFWPRVDTGGELVLYGNVDIPFFIWLNTQLSAVGLGVYIVG